MYVCVLVSDLDGEMFFEELEHELAVELLKIFGDKWI